MQTDWHGHYLDGKSALRRPVTIRLRPGGMEIVLADGTTLIWPFREIRLAQGVYAGEQIRLERGDPLPEALVVDDSAFLEELRRRGMTLPGRVHRSPETRQRTLLVIAGAAAGVLLLMAGYLWGLPALAAAVAPHVPVSWEEDVGRGVMDRLAPMRQRCVDSSLTRRVQEITTRLLTGHPNQPYTFRVLLVDNPIVNAYAAPGGYIVVYRGLIEMTDTAEELAGVLAHEMQHVLLRHTTQQLLHETSASLLITAVTGDAGAAAFGLRSAHLFGAMRYSRQHEADADLNGAKMLVAAGIDPRGMVSFFEKMEKKEADLPDFLQYVSTHPQTQERIDALNAYIRTAAHPAGKLVPDDEWNTIKNSCPAASDTSSAAESL